ncbi:hypothetical protein AVEN_198413-1, partial [Araneus ventricosus]
MVIEQRRSFDPFGL